MMKKLVLLAALILAAGMVFAQEEAAADESKPEFFDLEISAGFPVHWTNAENNGVSSKQVNANTSLGVALVFNFGRKVGLTLDTDFFYGASLSGRSNPTSNENSLFGANVLLGPVFYLYNGSFLRIPLAVGVHMYYGSSDIWEPAFGGTATGVWFKQQDLQIGPGAYIGVQFHFNNNIYIFSRTNVAVDVFRWSKATAGTSAALSTSETELKFGIAWEVKPAIGIGIKF
jgi:hypothetical protein